MKLVVALFLALLSPAVSATPSRPNILWITSEDNGPHLGCYGDKFADTPNLDRLATKSLRFLHCWSVAPVCAPARTTIISGLYPSASGSEHMRSLVSTAPGQQMYPQLLREAGYYCTNNAKEDYNLQKPGKVWDESSKKAHWRNRAPGQPFFAVFNFEDTHESQCRKQPHTFVHSPEKVPVPGFHPDCPEVRASWAQYYDQMTVMDRKAGALLAELEKDGLAEDTIVFYYGDHGPGLPRCKRTPCESGLRVPLIIHFPEKWRHLSPKDYAPGGSSDRLVSFVDFAPTVLSLAGHPVPESWQGLAFAGPQAKEPRQYNYGLRGRMDERYDLVRSVTDGRYVYVRNYAPHKPWGQHNAYMFETPMTRAWQKLAHAGKLPTHLSYFWDRKAPEELYDLTTDPFETKNLAASPEATKILERMRAENSAHLLSIRDVDFLPEAEMLARSKQDSPWQLGHDQSRYDLAAILHQADLASMGAESALPTLREGLGSADSGVRYWSAVGMTIRGTSAVRQSAPALEKLLSDPSPSVQVAAAEALAHFATGPAVEKALGVLLAAANVDKTPYYAAVAALNVLDELDAKAKAHLPTLKALPRVPKTKEPRTSFYPERLLDKMLADLAE